LATEARQRKTSFHFSRKRFRFHTMRMPFPPLAGLALSAALLAACATPGHDEIQAQFDAGLKAYDAGDYQTAYKTWDDIGDDKAAAIPWLARAATAGHPIATFELGQIYEDGKVVPQDLKEARRLYKIAAEAGITDAVQRLQELDGAAPAPPAAVPGHFPPPSH
jgi:TPR repeat protein